MMNRTQRKFEQWGLWPRYEERMDDVLRWLANKGLVKAASDFTSSGQSSGIVAPSHVDVIRLPVSRPEKQTKAQIDATILKWREENKNESAIDHSHLMNVWSQLSQKGSGPKILNVNRLPADAIAFYRPFHFDPPHLFGIYIFVDRLLQYFEGIKRCSNALSVFTPSALMHIVLFEMFHHEFFHHIVESAATTFEIINDARGDDVPVYFPYRERMYNGGYAWHPHQPLEEALANAYAYNSISFTCRVKTGVKDTFAAKYQEALVRHWDLEPPGYKYAANYIRGNQVIGASHLLGMLLGASSPRNEAPLMKVAQAVLPNGFSAFYSKPDIPTYLIGDQADLDDFYKLVPVPQEAYCNLFWPIDTSGADLFIKEKRDEEKRAREAARRKALQPTLFDA
ncbi:hypothetical protein [Azospirillum rugosum]|uniref:Uncharacterized protein n=1 Tax=Azospirillum rugosum TaxID=416170 RepID=A0ABS4SYN3_9PROT|nr:hypothetical protein [Azospirillum rugosum]MBP2297097.1 hypothetical protein [Azospirillum rugosum]MDQ0530937.1 hypothetical protein [Azospirillum rugosum]